jgi:sulfonate transport system permease protein
MFPQTDFRRRAAERAIQYLVLPATLLAIWQILFHAGFIRPVTLPPPTRLARTFLELVENGELFRHVEISVLRVLEGFALAALVGTVLGIGIGLSRKMDRLTDLILQLMKPIPPIAWIPMAILWFGIDEASKIFIIFMGAFFPILVNVTDGIRQTDRKYVEVARILSVRRGKFIRQVVIAGAFPSIMTGLRVGLGVAWICVVAAELIAASRGVGYMIMDARQLSQPDVVLVGMITIGVIGKLMDYTIKQAEHRLVTWKVPFQGEGR